MFVIMNIFASFLTFVSRIAGRKNQYMIMHGKPALGRYQVIPGKPE